MTISEAAPQGAGILIVDDDPANLAALEAVLEPLGQRVVRATSGREALRHLLHQRFALILLDVRMRDMDGFEVASLIRARPTTQATPIIFVTAFHEAEESMRRAYRLGAADFIFKPYAPEFLRAKVGVFVELYNRERAELMDAETELEVPAEPIVVRADAVHVSRILDNLLNNALTYVRGRPWIGLRVRVEEGEATVEVEDHGIGIPEHIRERVFERF